MIKTSVDAVVDRGHLTVRLVSDCRAFQMRAGLTALVFVLLARVAFAQGDRALEDALPSWNEGPAKTAIVNFVRRVVTPGQPDFVPEPERIAVFDNDGTLWCEQPVYTQLQFALDRTRELAASHPEWKTQAPFQTVLTGKPEEIAALGEKDLLQIIAATHAGQTTEEFNRVVREWIKTAQHPTLKRPYSECIYQPMLEVLRMLRANGFKTYIVSGGGVEFMRPWTEAVYGIPPEQVIGSSGVVKFEMRDGVPTLVKTAQIEFIDDGPGKPVGINRFIGRRPLMAFGNSDGDLQMLQWTTAGAGPRFGLLVHHTDAAREFAYDRSSSIGKLDKAWDAALASGWIVVDMRSDWKTIFPPSPTR